MADEVSIWLTLQARLDLWAETPLHMPDEKYTPGSDVAFIIVQPVTLDFVTEVIGYDCGEENRGVLSCGVMVPMEWTYSAHVGLAGRFMAHFPAGLRLDGLEIYRQPKVIAAPRIDGAWNRLDLQVFYRRWT